MDMAGSGELTDVAEVAADPRVVEGIAGTGSVDAAAELFRALASPHRVGILVQLVEGPCCVHELADHLGVSQPLVSQHLRVLRASRLVRTRRRGKEVTYSLGDDRVAHIVLDAIAHATDRAAS